MSFGNLKHSLSLQPVIFPGQSTVRWNDGTIERQNGGKIRNLDESLLPRTRTFALSSNTYIHDTKNERRKKKKKRGAKKKNEKDEKNGDKVASAFPTTLRVNLAGWKPGNVAIHATRTRLAPIVSTSPLLSPPLI